MHFWAYLGQIVIAISHQSKVFEWQSIRITVNEINEVHDCCIHINVTKCDATFVSGRIIEGRVLCGVEACLIIAAAKRHEVTIIVIKSSCYIQPLKDVIILFIVLWPRTHQGYKLLDSQYRYYPFNVNAK